ncbi:MAG: orotate phosphoribosyltransferase [Bdellovibrionaceae bacterium]|nr:orotate phosphoribosyltransferase [Pseudobdellovibrionaceae bacterium]MDW8189646.1 orotate phosphoribosyltransferase [Pseudobdellovibrionaceae bacterium]
MLRSGQWSQEYFDKYRIESDPRLLSEVARHMLPLIPPQTDVLAGLELGGIPLATALSLQSEIPVVFVRKKPKNYGTCRAVEGLSSLRGKYVLVVEDVITTGGQVLESVRELRKEGAHIVGILCMILRGSGDQIRSEGLMLRSLFRMEDVKK